MEAVVALEIFLWGRVSRGQNAILRGQKSKNLPKMADFGHFFLLTEGGQMGDRASDWGGGQMSHAPPPLDATIEWKLYMLAQLLFAGSTIATAEHFVKVL